MQVYIKTYMQVKKYTWNVPKSTQLVWYIVNCLLCEVRIRIQWLNIFQHCLVTEYVLLLWWVNTQHAY